MLAIEAIVDPQGNVRLLGPVSLQGPRPAWVVIFEDASVSSLHEVTSLSERSLRDDWDRPEEDAAWRHLQPVM